LKSDTSVRLAHRWFSKTGTCMQDSEKRTCDALLERNLSVRRFRVAACRARFSHNRCRDDGHGRVPSYGSHGHGGGGGGGGGFDPLTGCVAAEGRALRAAPWSPGLLSTRTREGRSEEVLYLPPLRSIDRRLPCALRHQHPLSPVGSILNPFARSLDGARRRAPSGRSPARSLHRACPFLLPRALCAGRRRRRRRFAFPVVRCYTPGVLLDGTPRSQPSGNQPSQRWRTGRRR
jgi:hypothetical protein